MIKRPFCILLTGLPNAGKSTIAYELVQKRIRNTLIIDGDRHREMQFLGEKLGFTKEDILKNNEHVIKLAQFAQEQKFNVIIAQIAPFKKQREDMRAKLKNYLEVFCECSDGERSGRPNFKHSDLVYEGGTADMAVSTEFGTIGECADIVLAEIDAEGVGYRVAQHARGFVKC